MSRVRPPIVAAALLALTALPALPAGAVALAGVRAATKIPRATPARRKKHKRAIELGTYTGTTEQGHPVTLTISRAGTDGLPCSKLCLATPGATVIQNSVTCGAVKDAATVNIRVLATRIPHGGLVAYASGDHDQPSTIALNTVTLTIDTRGRISGTLRSRVAAGDGMPCDSGSVSFTAVR